MDKNALLLYFIIHQINKHNRAHKEWKQNQKIKRILINKIKKSYLIQAYAIKVPIFFFEKIDKNTNYFDKIIYMKRGNLLYEQCFINIIHD